MLPYYICDLPQYECISRVLKPRYEATPSAWVVGSRNLYEYWDRWQSFGETYLIFIVAQVLKICFDSPVGHLLVIWFRKSSRVAAEIGDLQTSQRAVVQRIDTFLLWCYTPHTIHSGQQLIMVNSFSICLFTWVNSFDMYQHYWNLKRSMSFRSH